MHPHTLAAFQAGDALEHEESGGAVRRQRGPDLEPRLPQCRHQGGIGGDDLGVTPAGHDGQRGEPLRVVAWRLLSSARAWALGVAGSAW
jgi:hypothetical protein